MENEKQPVKQFSTRDSGIAIGILTFGLLPLLGLPLIIALILLAKENTKVFAQGMLIGMAITPLLFGGLCLGIYLIAGLTN